MNTRKVDRWKKGVGGKSEQGEGRERGRWGLGSQESGGKLEIEGTSVREKKDGKVGRCGGRWERGAKWRKEGKPTKKEKKED